jgi:multidrug transporter EmrE-like cation transporter
MRRDVRHLTWKADVILLVAFLNYGLVSTLHKAVGIYAPPEAGSATFLFFHPQQLTYEACLFLVAGVCSAAYALARRGGWGRVELALGSVVGVSNVLGTMFSVVGLSILAAGVFFPTLTCALVVLSVVVSRLLWGERVTRRQIVGLVLAVCIVVMVNL